PDDAPHPKKRPRASGGKIVIAQVHAVRVRHQREVDPVVNQTNRSRRAAERAQPPGRVERLPGRGALHAQLNDANAAVEQQLALLDQRQLGADAVVANGVQTAWKLVTRRAHPDGFWHRLTECALAIRWRTFL